MSYHELAIVVSLLARGALPVIAVMLYAGALASAVYMLRDKGTNARRSKRYARPGSAPRHGSYGSE